MKQMPGDNIGHLYAFNGDNYLFVVNKEDKDNMPMKISLDTILTVLRKYHFNIEQKRVWAHLENPA